MPARARTWRSTIFPTEEPDAREVIALIEADGPQGRRHPRRPARRGVLPASWWPRRCSGLGGLDILVSNAGRQQTHDSILDISTEDFDATMKTNIYAPFWIIKAALPHLKPGSAIIATTSEQAYDPSPELYDYAQTKAATMNYVKSLAKQLGAQGHPGERRGARARSGRRCRSAAAPRMEKLEKFGGQTPLGRPGQPAELGSIYVQLAAADASYATGQVYGAAGGAGQP